MFSLCCDVSFCDIMFTVLYCNVLCSIEILFIVSCYTLLSHVVLVIALYCIAEH